MILSLRGVPEIGCGMQKAILTSLESKNRRMSSGKASVFMHSKQ